MGDIVITKSLALTDDQLVLGVVDNPVAGLEVSGTWTGTLNIESNVDPDNAVWAAAQVFTSAGVGAASTMTANGRRLVQAVGVGQIRVRFNPASSGIAIVTLRAGDGSLGGSGGGGGGGASTIVDGGDVAGGATGDAAVITDTNGTRNSFLRGAIVQWAAYLARFPASLGTKTAAASLPVALSSDGTFATLAGAVNETAPASDIASSGSNGRLQRIAQRLSSLITLFPTSLDGSGNFKVSLQTTLNEGNDSVTGHIGGYSKLATLTMTRPANTTPYTAGDEIADTAGTAAQRTFACARVNNGTGVITGASLIYSNNPAVTPVLELYLFDTDPTSAGDNAAFAPTDAQLATSIGVITFPAPKVGTTGTGGNLLYDSGPLSIEFAATGGTTSIFGLLVTRIGFTPIANSETLTIRLRTEQN